MDFPDADGFESADPEEVGLDPDAVADAVDYHLTHGTSHETINYDFGNMDPWDESEGEYGEQIGPHPERRGGPAGLILKEGKLVAEWGDTRRVDQTFSVAKSFISMVGGRAFEKGLFDVDDPVRETVDDGGFESEHNRQITWRHLFEQTSEWEGTLFGKPDAVDRNRAVGKDGQELDKAETRDLKEPGTFFEYNDVRINRLALSLLRVLGRPLPAVLRKEIMQPIGATDTWQWHGYYNATVDVDGTTMRSVTGGGHWGGGLWIAARDLARVGHLMLNGGEWDGKQVLPEAWVEQSTTPSDVFDGYGFLWWLNTDGQLWPSAPESAYAALGHGQNTVFVDPEHDLVVVLRWLHLPDDRGDVEYLPAQEQFHATLQDGLE
ncbi:serine hydrolase domain-containing protein [Haloparvum sp. AD34]